MARGTQGRLTPEEQRRLAAVILRAQVDNVAGRVRLALGRRPGSLPGVGDLPVPPDSVLARAAEAACLELDGFLVAHSYRTWLYGWVLAAADGAVLDRELAYAAALLHDVGLATPTPGQDFTVRSAQRAREVMTAAGVSDGDVQAVRDAISVHTLPGSAPNATPPWAPTCRPERCSTWSGFAPGTSRLRSCRR